jgi:type IV secretory pathway VirJ component
MPFLYNRLPDEIKQIIKQIILITPAASSDFEIHLTDMIGVDHDYIFDVEKEVEKIKIPKITAIFGEDENSTFPADHKQDNFKVHFVKGSHHFKDAIPVMDIILKGLK